MHRNRTYLYNLGLVTSISTGLPEEANELNVQIVGQARDLALLFKYCISLQRLGSLFNLFFQTLRVMTIGTDCPIIELTGEVKRNAPP